MKKVLSSLLATSFILGNIGLSAIAASASEEIMFTAVVNVYNEETKEPITGIDVKFVEYDADLPTIPEPQAEVVQILSEWNTTDTNPYEIADIEFVKGHFYAVQIDNIPEGYCYSWEDHVVTGIHGNGTLTGTVKYDIALQPHDPLPNLEYPLDIEREFAFTVIDKSTNQIIEGLDVELAKMELDSNVINKYNYVETVDSWNTDADSHAINIPITYDTHDSPSAIFGIKINNMPEGYTYYQEPEDGYTICGYYGAYDYRYDLYIGNNSTECIAYIYPEDKPHVYVTTASTENAITTITTTTSESSGTEKITDIKKIREMISQYIENNNVDAEIVSDEKYPQYADSVVIEFNMKTNANTEILKFAEAENIERTCFNLVPCENKVAITTVNPDSATTTTTTTTIKETNDSKDIYFSCQYEYVPAEVGFNCGVAIAGYEDDKFYEVGVSPIEFSIEDENIAKISNIQGLDVNIIGVSVGETTLNAITPDGRTASIKVVVTEAPSTSTTAVWNHSTTTTTTTVENNVTEELPQTGMPYTRAVEGIAALLTLGGAALIIKSRKENDET